MTEKAADRKCKVAIPKMLTPGTDGDSVASELTDPLATLVPSASESGSFTKLKANVEDSDSDTDTESETETEYDSQTDSSFSNGSSSDGYETDEEDTRYQPSLRRVDSKSMSYFSEDDPTEFDPFEVISDFARWLFDSGNGDGDSWSNALYLSDKTLLDQHIGRSSRRATTRKRPSSSPSLAMHNMLSNERHVESGRHLYGEVGDLYNDHVVVATEALALCDVEADSTAFPHIICNNLVGKVHHLGSEAKQVGFKEEMRVASITKCEYNSKYVSMPVDHLYVIPKALDAAEVAALFANYLPAFQALHHGRVRPERYSRTCLKGKKVLVIGGNRLEAQAALHLARFAGARELFVTAPNDHFDILSKIGGVRVLEDFPKDEWLNVVRGTIDLVIDYEFPECLETVLQALTPKGRLVCVASKKKPLLSRMYEQYRLSAVKRASLFDFSENFVENLEDVHEDVRFLLKQLSRRRIRPSIDRYVQLREVPMLGDRLLGIPLAGAVICEPRKDLPVRDERHELSLSKLRFEA